MSKSEVAFTGEVFQTTCQCHPNQFVVVTFFIDPFVGRQPLESRIYPTEAEANAALEPFVNECADKMLKLMGLSRDTAAHVDVQHGDQAIRAERSFRTRNNTDLH